MNLSRFLEYYCLDFIKSGEIVIFHNAILLLLLVVKKFGTGYLTTTNKPTVFGKVSKNIRFTGALWSQFNNIESWLYKYQQTSDKFQLLCKRSKTGCIIFHRRQQEVNPLFCGECFTSIFEIVNIDRLIRFERLIINHLDVVIFAVAIGQKSQLDNSPLFTIHQFAGVGFINILRNLPLVLFYTHIRNRKTANAFHEVDINDKTSKQGEFLAAVEFIFDYRLFGRNNHIKERSEFFTIDAAVRVDISLEQKVFDE